MNYRVLVDGKMEEFRSLIPDYTFSQTVLAVLKNMDGFENFTKSDLLSISDEDFYSAAEKALKKESQKLNKYN
jgi:hypothetical protein